MPKKGIRFSFRVARFVLLVLATMTVLWVATPRAFASTLCVNPGGTGGCYSSIQSAITAAGSGDTIVIAGGTYHEHDVDINKSLTLVGAGTGTTIIDGDAASRVLYVSVLAPTAVSVSQLTLRNGNVSGSGGGLLNYAALTLNNVAVQGNIGISGGGIGNTATLILNDVTVTGNTASTANGGGINNGASSATLTMNRVVVNDNHTTAATTAFGAGVYLYDGSRADITDSTISNNGITFTGGGIATGPSTILTVLRSTISGNTIGSGAGAGLWIEGTADMTNVTISGNNGIAANGGGIASGTSAVVNLLNVTIANNTLTSFGNGGGINAQGTFNIKNSIVAGNSAATSGANCLGSALVSLGYNLENANTCPFTATGDKPNTPPLLGPLQLNGGPTMTHALLSGSPAIDAADLATCPTRDQRGLNRPIGFGCDMGAFEARFFFLPLVVK